MLEKARGVFRFWRYYVTAKLSFCRSKGHCLLLVGTPLHGNIGDQAIVLGEKRFFSMNYPDITLLEVPSRAFMGHEAMWKKLGDACSLILVHGGGYLGTIWPDEDKMVRSCLETFKNEPIVILPQTLYFEHGDKDEMAVVYNKALESCVDVTVLVREGQSFDLAKRCFPSVSVHLAPDMVLALDGNNFGQKRVSPEANDRVARILLCFRSDKEKMLDDADVEVIEEGIRTACGRALIAKTDTVIPRKVTPSNRRSVVIEKIDEFRQADLVVTDRLHGMVLSAISGTPTIALKSKSPKIEGVYDQWLKGLDNVVLACDIKEVSQLAKTMLGERVLYDASTLHPKYSDLCSKLNQLLSCEYE